ncbi:MAG: FAD-dependent oxidoreductase [Pseudomonadota bacterium]|nr:FAD-dependent oxidoreductase [Pseudomonadota bacterium]
MSDTIATPAARVADTELMETKTMTEAPRETGVKRKLKADLIVIGGGSGGLSAAAGAAMLGLNVILYEKHEMGGDCLNYGCVPSKALLTTAKYAQSARESAKYGVSVSDPAVDWENVKAHVQSAIDTIAPVDSQERFEGLGVTVIREHAQFKDRKTIQSATTEATARRIIVSTGSTAFIPPIPGLDETPYITNETVFSLPEQPKHLVILGGGPIGMEMAQAFHRLGSEVTVIEMGRAMARADADHAKIAIREEGVAILEGHKAVKITGSEGSISVDTESEDGTKTITGTHLLVAVGRRAMLDGLELEAGKVDFDRSGIQVSDKLRSVSNPRVWALGDIAGQGQFTHLAGWHASVFTRRAFFKQGSKASDLPLPAVTYVAPEVAQVGLTEAEAREQFGDSVTTSSFPFHENDRAIAEGKTLGEAKLVIRKGKILGASVVGEGAGDIIQIVGYGMSNKLGVQSLTNFISPYPTRAEIVKRAASAHFTPTVFGKASRTLVGLLQRIP